MTDCDIDGILKNREEQETEVVWVVLCRLSTDIAEPGRGLGLGLGGPSDPDSEPSIFNEMLTGGKSAESYDLLAAKEVGPNRSSFLKVPDALLLNESRIRGLRPLARTFFRALMPMQSTSCFIASRSETARRAAVRRMVLVRGSV